MDLGNAYQTFPGQQLAFTNLRVLVRDATFGCKDWIADNENVEVFFNGFYINVE